MEKKISVTCPRCARANWIPRPTEATGATGTELDGRPLTATATITLTWRWTCAGCGQVSPSAEAARLLLAKGEPEAAIEVARLAAWVADDHTPEDAFECRATAAWLLRRLGGSDELRADMHRRNGDFEAATAAARHALGIDSGSERATLARRELQLARAGDSGRHSMVALFQELSAEVG